MWTREGRIPLWIAWALAIGLAARIVVLWQTADLGLHIADERHYAQLAGSLLRGDGFAWETGEPTSLRPPFYPAMLAVIWTVTGEGDLQAVRAVQIALALLTAAIVYALGTRVSGAGLGAVAATIVWLYPPLAYLNFTILTETLFTLLVTAFALFAVMLVQQPRAWTAAACGLTLGLAALTRSVLWPLPILLCPLLVLVLDGPFRRRAVLSGLVLVCYAVVVAPWAVRNTRLQGVVTIVDTMGGMNLRMGNYEHTPEDRMWDAVSVSGEKSWVHALAEEGHPAGSAITEGQKEKWAQRKALDYMRANPGTTLRRAAIKFADLWGLDRSYAAAVQQGLYRPSRWLGLGMSVVMALSSAVFLILSGAAVWLARPEWRLHLLLLLPVLAVTAAHTIVFGHARYHLPLVPILAVYVAALPRGGPLVWLDDKPAVFGAIATVLVLLTSWVRQILAVDAGRISAFVERLL